MMDATHLIEGYKSIIRAIYSQGEYYQRALNCLEPVVGDAPGEFWRYLRHALSRHREKFADAVRLAAVGYHFRKLTGGLNG